MDKLDEKKTLLIFFRFLLHDLLAYFVSLHVKLFPNLIFSFSLTPSIYLFSPESMLDEL